MLSKMLSILKQRIDYPTIIIIIITAIYIFTSDTYYYKKRGYLREVKIIKGIFYSYMTIGGIMYILLLIMWGDRHV